MSIGAFARKVLGPVFPRVASLYRSIFVDIAKVATALEGHIPIGAHVLDVGGGDGAILARLLAERGDLRVTMIDLAGSLGQFIPESLLSRVTRLPRTSMRQYAASSARRTDCVIISDVVHHVPHRERATFFDDLADLVRQQGTKQIIVKDIEPGFARSRLSLLADRYVSGDRTVSLVSRNDVIAHMKRVLGDGIAVTETSLFATDCPNYALSFSIR